MRFENQESELQQRIDDERNKKTALETSKAMKNNTLVRMGSVIQQVQNMIRSGSLFLHLVIII